MECPAIVAICSVMFKCSNSTPDGCTRQLTILFASLLCSCISAFFDLFLLFVTDFYPVCRLTIFVTSY